MLTKALLGFSALSVSLVADIPSSALVLLLVASQLRNEYRFGKLERK